MKFINKVTVTGADESNNYEELAALHKEYPFVEFGILLSRNAAGRVPRFPSANWILELNDFTSEQKLPLAGHLCGSWVREVLDGELDFRELYPWLSMFDRYQINTHAEEHSYSLSRLELLLWLAETANKEIIFQYDNANTVMIRWALNKSNNVSILYDLSHGAGVLPSSWPKPVENAKCGYAGGLSHFNVADQIEIIAEQVPKGTNIWIDAETKLRSNNDSVFNLDKVELFLMNAKPYVVDPE